VGLEPGQRARSGAAGDDEILGVELADRLAVLGDAEASLAEQLPLAVDHRDLVLLHQEADAVRKLLCHLARALDHFLGVIGDLLGGEAIGIEAVQQVVDLGASQQRLGRDAAPVEADAAEMLALDHRRLHAELRGADRRDIAARPAAENEGIEGCVCQKWSPVAVATPRHPRPPAASRRVPPSPPLGAKRVGVRWGWRQIARCLRHHRILHYSASMPGASMIFLKAWIHCAPTAPSMTR